MNNEQFRAAAYALIDRIVTYREELASKTPPVLSKKEPGEILRALPTVAPEQPENLAAVLQDLDEHVFSGVMHWQHPRFFGYFPVGGGLASVLAAIVTNGLGVIGLNWQSAPALTEIETAVMVWMRDLLGLSSAWNGVIQDSASSSAVVALICARERTTAYSAAAGGLQAESTALTVYTTAEAHSSVVKAATLAGFGHDNVRLVETDADFSMNTQALQAAISEDRAAGKRPCAIVATVGTTSTTAVDPIEAIAAIAVREGIWLHVDSAMAGSAMLAPEFRHYWQGLESADSLVVNAHKWMTMAPECSFYFVRDAEHLVRVMSTNPSYLRTDVDGEVINYRDWGIPLGRTFRALKVWLTLRLEGADALRQRIRRDCGNTAWLAQQVDATDAWERVAPAPFQTICLIHKPLGLEGEALDAHTLDWCRQINNSGFAYLTPAIVGERWIVRVSVGSELMEREDVEALWEVMRKTAEDSAHAHTAKIIS
ncbi:pyridoxal phosphate-dependent decarboxylase family protein [Paraburkholderia phenoliruptrix]|uniref:pyridoxal phosphate-dependent decarboxylase family protein n=1 Tax=Paraburkholderia phenoliruptrix TaxID=252970 RepID=UPI0028573B93|nr:aminotransferase class V-fold PLP-dependent enzyme [Paraburkholderia phenoliruptrix]MDR6391803.1 aromatic-L-amino-acid decarboxylase [Paraburkholderia phenoliruptrix]